MDTRHHTSSAFIKVENNEKTSAQGQLPSSYGKTEAFLLPKDPSWLFMFWEIIATTFDYIKSQNGFDIFDKSKPVVRLHDVTGITFNGFNSNSTHDTDIVFDSKSWYLQAPAAGRTYVADLGLITQQGKFILIARTNSVTLPTGRVSEVVDEQWMTVDEKFQKLYAMSGANLIGLGASELAVALHERWRFTESMPSSYVSSNMSSKDVMPPAPPKKEDAIWLKADCEIIIYGSASPGCEVRIKGKVVELSDGSFSIRQSLHKGEVIDLPITAQRDGMKRSLKIKAERED